MSEQAQSSGHEWAATSAGDKKFTVVCRCGAHLEADADAMIAAHVASVAQAAQPQEVPAEQREPLNAEVEHIIASAFSQMKCQCGDCVRVRAAEEYNRHLPQPASAAKPAEDGLEAQCRGFVLENSGYGVETLTANLAAFIRALHPSSGGNDE